MRQLKNALRVMLLVSGTAQADDLIAVYQQALQADPQLKTAEYKVDVSNAQKGQALGRLLPQVTGTANWSTNDQQIANFDNINYKGTRYYVSLSQSLLDLAKFWDWKRAREVENQYASELIDAQHTLIFNVVERYFAVLDAEDQLHLTQEEKRTTETELEQIKKQFSKQLIKITDVYEAEARLDQLKADEIEAESILFTARQALSELTNTPAQPLDRLREDIEYHELEGKLDDWLAVAKSENPLLAAEQSAVEAASNNVTVQKSRYLPVVDLQLNYYNTDTGYQSVQISQTQTQTAAINVNVPIFTGGTTTHRVFEAQSQLEMAKQQREAKTRALIKETTDAFTISNAHVRRIKASVKALQFAQKSREAMQRGLKFGVVTVADLLRAQETELKAQRELVRARYQYIIDRVRFLKAIGTVSEENLQEINGWLIKQ